MCLSKRLIDAYPSLKRLWPGPASLPGAKLGPAPLTFAAGTLLITSQSWPTPFWVMHSFFACVNISLGPGDLRKLCIYALFQSTLFLKFCSQWASYFPCFQCLAGVRYMRASSFYLFITVNTPGPGVYLSVETPWCFVSGECVLTFPCEHSTFHTELLLKPELGLPCPHGPLPVDSPSLAGS